MAEDSPMHLRTMFTEWQKASESKGLKINATKTEAMLYQEAHEPPIGLITDHKGAALK
jgi:hypothetical protein